MGRFVPRQLVLFFLALAIFVVAAIVLVGIALRTSLPLMDGEGRLSGLQSAVRIERDALGMPTIHAATTLDAMRVLGFLHAQERFFQMDLLRRSAAGELAELFGAAALPQDRGHRFHRLRTVASAAFKALPTAQRDRLIAYREGVNEGLRALRTRPPEYLALAIAPAPWQAEDSLLVILAMFLDLQDETAQRDADLGRLREHFSPSMVAFLVPAGTEWDAPIEGNAQPAPPVPSANDLRASVPRGGTLSRRVKDAEQESQAVGSNAWAVSGSHTTHGGALIAGDMHLGLAVPNIWYRAAWRVGGERSGPSGLTLPGVPALVAGSNGHIAWTFTNSYGDFSDLIELELDAAQPGHYRSGESSRPFEFTEEMLRVRGGPDESLLITQTQWGPLVDADSAGRLRALRWIAHFPDAVNLALVDLEGARDVNAALIIANNAGVPAQNFIVGDAQGHIAWTIAGRLPQRSAATPFPVSAAAPPARWHGWLAADQYPQVVDPPTGKLWSGNQRMVDVSAFPALGNGGFQLGARARQIRDALAERTRFDEREMLAIQLDDRALFLERWQQLLLSVLTPEALRDQPHRQALREAVAQWGGRAAIDSAGYRLVRAFRLSLAQQVFDYLLAEVAREDARFDYLAGSQWEGPLWHVVTSRPAHLLNPAMADWNAQLLAAADAVVQRATQNSTAIENFTWGRLNQLRMQHPLSHAAPWLGRWLDMPPEPMPGDQHMPRVQAPSFGASQRLVIAPGQEEHALLQMPGGQSGHFFSPHYRDGLESWIHGDAVPLLPGPVRHTAVLRPTRP